MGRLTAVRKWVKTSRMFRTSDGAHIVAVVVGGAVIATVGLFVASAWSYAKAHDLLYGPPD